MVWLRSASSSCLTRVLTSGDRDLNGPGGVHLVGHLVGLLNEELNDLAFRNGTDDLAMLEDLALAIAGGNTQVSFAAFSEPIDDATHDSDAQRSINPFKGISNVIGQR